MSEINNTQNRFESYSNKFINDIKYNVEHSNIYSIYSKLSYQIKRDNITQENRETICYIIQGLYKRFDVEWVKYDNAIQNNENWEEEKQREKLVELILCIRKVLKRFKVTLDNINYTNVTANYYHGVLEELDDKESVEILHDRTRTTNECIWIVMRDGDFNQHQIKMFEMLTSL